MSMFQPNWRGPQESDWHICGKIAPFYRSINVSGIAVWIMKTTRCHPREGMAASNGELSISHIGSALGCASQKSTGSL